MLYALIIIHALQPTQFYIYKDLEECLTQKELRVKEHQDAHCIRLEEPASTVKDLAPNNTK
jgi:hypothetical protein